MTYNIEMHTMITKYLWNRSNVKPDKELLFCFLLRKCVWNWQNAVSVVTDPAYSALAILDFKLRKESNLKMHYFLLISTPCIVSLNGHLLYAQPKAA